MLRGARTPTHRLVGPSDYTYGDDAARFLASLGLHLDPWQLDILSDWLAEDRGRWSHRDAVLLVPRQNGKSFILAARILVGLFMLPDERKIMFSAHDSKPMREVFGIVRDVIGANPALDRRTAKIRLANGQESVETRDGSKVHFVARTNNIRSAFRGFSPDLVILDEALVLSDDSWSAILPTVSARPNPQIILSSSAGTAESVVLARFRTAGHEGTASRLCLHEWEASGLDRADPASWAAANPSLGFRLSPETIEAEFRSMAPDAFDRERLGVWSSARTESALSIDGYASVGVASVALPTQATVSIDVHQIPGGERVSAVVLTWLADGVPTSILWRQEPGVRWLPAQLVADVQRFAADGVFMSVGGARDVVEEIEAAGVKVHGLALAEWKSACTGLGQAVADDACRVQVAQPLSAAVAAAEARHWPEGAWTFDGRKTSGVPIPGLVAWAVGVWAVKSTQAADYDVLSSVF